MLLAYGCVPVPSLTLAQQAHKLGREGNWAGAYELYGSVLCAQPHDLTQARNWVEAWVHLDAPGTPQMSLGCTLPPVTFYYAEGMVQASLGHYAEADAAFASADAAARESGVAADGSVPALRAQRAEILYRRGLAALQGKAHQRALEHLNHAAGLAPGRAAIRLGIAHARLLREEYNLVAGELEGMLRLGPSPQELERGRSLLAQAVARSQPPLAEGLAAEVKETLGALDRAELSRERALTMLALAKEAPHPRVLTVAGMVALRMGLPQDAARYLQEAARLNPVDPDPLRILAVSRGAADRALEALEPLRGALRRDPLDLELTRLAARAAQDAGDRALALWAYQRLTVLEANVPEHHLWVARLARQEGQLDQARVAVESGYALERTSIPVLVERAVIHARLARVAPTAAERRAAHQTARSTVEELLNVAPEHPSAQVIIDSLP